MLTVQNAKLPVAVFDSGVGGLSVLLQLQRLLPMERFVFLADEAFLPYGDKPQHEILARVQSIGHFFYRYPCKALVVACNTATAAGIEGLRQTWPSWPVIGMEPAVKPAALLTRSGCVGILATSNTLASERFRNLVARFDDKAKVIARPCPGLVELIEQSPMSESAIVQLLKPHVEFLMNQGVDVIVLGCTHYPFVTKWIQQLVGPEVQVLETGLPVAKQLQARLAELNLLSSGPDDFPHREAVYYLTTASDAMLFTQKLCVLTGFKAPQVRTVQVL